VFSYGLRNGGKYG